MPSENNSQTFVFFGIAGSGKGTQAKLLADLLKARDGSEVVYISPGVEYRKLIESGNYTASLVKGPLTRGELLPGFLTDSIVAGVFISSLSHDKHIIADGYPRAVTQSVSFEAMMEFYKREDVKIIYIKLSEEEATKRNLLRGRSDDTEEGLKKRFNEYKNSVLPAMDYFKDKENYKIFSINGEQSVEDVHKDILKVLGL